MTDTHSHTPRSFHRAFVIGILLNTAFVAVEAFFGWRVNSLALLADAGHNLSDVAGLLLAWGGVLISRPSPNTRHTYGWRRGTILAAFANAVLLLLAMGSLGWEAIGRLRSPEPTQGLTVVVVAAVGIVVNTTTALLFVRGGQRDLNVRAAFLHMLADGVVSAGVVVGGLLALGFGWERIDPLFSLVIAVVIVFGTWNLFRQSLHLLFDGVPGQIDLNAVIHYLESLPGVDRVHDLHVWAMGTSNFALTAHVIMPSGHPNDSFYEMATRELHERFDIEHVTIQVITSPFTPSCIARPLVQPTDRTSGD